MGFESAELAPVVLFVYNRPEHTKRTLESFAKNPLAERSRLYIFSDGPKSGATPSDLRRVAEVRALIRERPWAGEVGIHESPDNLGLADSIIDGIRFVLRHHDRVIVLEDDIELSPGFLTYMNASLSLYSEDDRVKQVSGFAFPVTGCSCETYFMDLTNCWGWGTWRRAFWAFESDAQLLLRELATRGLEDEFTRGGVYPDFLRQLRANAEGRRRTWAIKWYASVFLNRGLTLYPTRPLVKNIGLDGSGENCRGQESLDEEAPCELIQVTRIPVECHPDLRVQIREHLASLNERLGQARQGIRRSRWADFFGRRFLASAALRVLKSLRFSLAKRG